MGIILNKKEEVISKPSTQQEYEDQIQLLKPLTVRAAFYKKWKNFSAKVWQIIHHRFSNVSLLKLVVLFIVVAIASSFITKSKIARDAGILHSSDRYSDFGQLEELRRSHDNYYKATPLQRRIRWMTMFYDWKWVRNGDPKYNEADCVGSIFMNLGSWGANFKLKTIPDLMRKVRILEENDVRTIRRSLNEVRSGDLIILDYGGGNLHIGQVFDTKNGYVRYSSVNAGVMTEGEDYIKWGDPRISMVIFICFDLWAGDIISKINK